MASPNKVLVGISGGLDSTYTAYLLKKEGYIVEGVHFSNGFVSDTAVDTINKSIDFLKIPITYVDVKDKFDTLLHNVDIEMCHMKTPNICVMCARDIKFGFMMKYALENNYNYFATGHYVRLVHLDNDVQILRAIDDTRDQSYGFGVIPKESLIHALTPLGSHIKTDIREDAIKIGLPFITSESHGLCFTHEPFDAFYPKISSGIIHGNFLINGLNYSKPHTGQQLYTRGQKIVVGKCNGKEKNCQYVVDKKLPSGDIVLSKKEAVFENIVNVCDLNFMVSINEIIALIDGHIFQTKIRYNANLVNCQFIRLTENSFTLTTEVPVYAPTSGQICTVYHNDKILVGGFIY